MKRILITGGNGFIGRACLSPLRQRGFEVHAVSRTHKSDSNTAIWHLADIQDDSRMSSLLGRIRPTHLLHLAWCTQPGRFWHTPENLKWLQSSIRLFHAFQNSGGTRIVAAGSCAEYDWTVGRCSEFVTPCRPNTLYGRAKLAAATYLDALNCDQLSTAWARLFLLYGPGASNEKMPGAVISSLCKNELARCSHGEQLRDFLHIYDVANALVAVTDSTVNGPINICSGEAVPIRHMAQEVARLMDKTSLLRLGELPTPLHDPPLIVGDTARLRNEVGWKPKFTLEEGLQHTVASALAESTQFQASAQWTCDNSQLMGLLALPARVAET